MTIIKRCVTALLTLLGLALLAGGAAVLWVDSALAEAPSRSAEVVLSGSRVTDLDLPTPGGQRVRHLQVLTDGNAALIGSSVDVQVVDSPVTVARLAADDRWATWGIAVAAAGAVLLVVLGVVVARARSRRRRDAADAGTRAEPLAASLALLLLLSGCTWTGDDVDRDAYRAARTSVAAALPVMADVDPVPPVAGAPRTAVEDPESAVAVVLAAAGLPTDPSTVTAARFVTRQLFDPAMLCGDAPATPLLELMVPDLAAQVGVADAPLRLGDVCPDVSFDVMWVGAARGKVVDGILSTGRGGTTVALTVSAVYRAANAGGAPIAVERDVRVGLPTDQPDRIVAVSWEAAGVGAGIGTGALPELGALPAWDDEVIDGPEQPDPGSAAAIIQALAATLASDAVDLGHEVDVQPSDGEDVRFTGSGFLAPTTGEAHLTYDGADFRETRILEHRRQFMDWVEPDANGETWDLYVTAVAPRLGEGSSTYNPYAVLDWLRHLSVAAPTDCPQGIEAGTCHAVDIPTAATLTPGTPGYREAMVHARRGNPTMTMVVGLTGGRLAAVRMSRDLQWWDGTSSRTTSTWTFAPREAVTPVPEVQRPPSWSDDA